MCTEGLSLQSVCLLTPEHTTSKKYKEFVPPEKKNSGPADHERNVSHHEFPWYSMSHTRHALLEFIVRCQCVTFECHDMRTAQCRAPPPNTDT